MGVLSFRDSGKEMEGAEGFYQASFAKKYGMSLYLFSVMPNLSISFFSPLKQRHAGKIFVFFMYPPLALAPLKGKRTRFRRNKMKLWRTVELLQMDLLCSVASPCWFQMYCQIQRPSKQQSWHHICRFRVRGWRLLESNTGSAEHRSMGKMGPTFWFRCRFVSIFNLP